MENVHIYLSGGMSGLTPEASVVWRSKIRDALKYQFQYTKNPIIFSPPDYYSPDTNAHTCEREAMEYDLAVLRKSDVVIVNFNNPRSIGTAMELAIAMEHRIPIIGFNASATLHPWLKECCTRICSDLRNAAEHVSNFYLN